MHPVIVKTLGGLSASYYFRQFIFGLTIPIFIYLMSSKGGHAVHAPLFLLTIANTLLYPYARFVYESVVNFVMGENVFFVNIVLMLTVKIVSMVFCWMGALFVAPVGLAYLYYHHSKGQR